MRILIAEDHPGSRELMRAVLESSGHHVMEAADGQQAIELARTHPVDLLLVDLQMPAVDGFGVLARLRDEGFSQLPIVAVTASAMHGDRERALAAGFSAYLPKPVDWNSLRAEIQRLVPHARDY